MAIGAVQGTQWLYTMRPATHAPSSMPADPVLVEKDSWRVGVGGPSASESAAKNSQRQQDFFGVGATDAQSGRSAWEPVGNLEILDMRQVFLEMRSVPMEQGPGFIKKYLEELNDLSIDKWSS